MQRKILIVDDDKKTVDLIRFYIEREGYQVLAAYDGQEALDIARQQQLDLIILDWMENRQRKCIGTPAFCVIIKNGLSRRRTGLCLFAGNRVLAQHS